MDSHADLPEGRGRGLSVTLEGASKQVEVCVLCRVMPCHAMPSCASGRSTQRAADNLLSKHRSPPSFSCSFGRVSDFAPFSTRFLSLLTPRSPPTGRRGGAAVDECGRQVAADLPARARLREQGPPAEPWQAEVRRLFLYREYTETPGIAIAIAIAIAAARMRLGKKFRGRLRHSLDEFMQRPLHAGRSWLSYLASEQSRDK